MQRVTIEFEDIDIKDIDYINVNFKDGRPTMTKTTSRPDENGKIITSTVIQPYDAERSEKRPFQKKVER